MELGAVVMVPAGGDLSRMDAGQRRSTAASEKSQRVYSSRMPILGNDVLRSWTERVRKLGVQSLWLTSSPTPSRLSGERALYSTLAGLAREGIERLLLIKLKSYAEMDLADLLRFHRENRSSVTEAQDDQGRLGVSLLDDNALQATGGEHEFLCAGTDGGRMPYRFRGYAKRILAAKERQELVGDGLTGACAMRPLGTEIRKQVWAGEGVNLAASARIIGPTYIGARTTVRAGATVGPYASVEHDCVVDCGTTVEQATILPNTYLAPGLLIRHALVEGRYLEDLGSGAVADLQPAGLGSSILRRESLQQSFGGPPIDVFAGIGSGWGFAPFSTASQPWLQVHL